MVEKLDLASIVWRYFFLPLSQMWIFLRVHQTKISLLSIDHVSLKLSGPALVWNDNLQRPVERSQALTIPAESVKIVIPSFACKVTDMGKAELCCVDSESVIILFAKKVLIGQNLIDPSEHEKRWEEESAIVLKLPFLVSTRKGSDSAKLQIWMALKVVPAKNLPLGEKQRYAKLSTGALILATITPELRFRIVATVPKTLHETI